MEKQRRGLNRCNMLQDTKKRKKKVSIHMYDTLKLTVKKKTQEKIEEKRQQQKMVLTGFEPTSTKIDGF